MIKSVKILKMEGVWEWECFLVKSEGFWSRWFLIVVSFFDHNILFDFSIELSKTKVIIFETEI